MAQAFTRLLVQKIEVDPGTGEVLMHLFSRPPVPVSRGGHKGTPPPQRRVFEPGW